MDTGLTLRAHDWLREILRAGHHLLELINDVLDLARVESGGVRLSLEPVALPPLLEETVALLGPLARQRHVTLHLPPPGQLPLLRADRTRLRQVLMNLVANAIKYNREGGSVRLEISTTPGAHCRVTVRDTGPGLTPSSSANCSCPSTG